MDLERILLVGVASLAIAMLSTVKQWMLVRRGLGTGQSGSPSFSRVFLGNLTLALFVFAACLFLYLLVGPHS